MTRTGPRWVEHHEIRAAQSGGAQERVNGLTVKMRGDVIRQVRGGIIGSGRMRFDDVDATARPQSRHQGAGEQPNPGVKVQCVFT